MVINMWQETVELIATLIIFLGVLALTYYVTKKLGSIHGKMGGHKNMEVIEVLPLMQGQYLYIVRVGKDYYLMGCSQKGTIVSMDKIEEEKLKLGEEKPSAFQEQFMYFMKGRQEKENER